MQTSTAKQIVVNTVFVSGLVSQWFTGHLQFVFSHDVSGLSYVIVGILAISLFISMRGDTSHLFEVRDLMVSIGLTGSLIGLIVLISGLDFNTLGTIEGVRTIGEQVLKGMGIAFCSSLVGAIASVWIYAITILLGIKP